MELNEAPAETSANLKKIAPTSKANFKQKRNHPKSSTSKQSNNSGQRHGGAVMGSNSIPVSICVRLDQPSIPIYASNFGIYRLVDTLYGYLTSMIRFFPVTREDMLIIAHASWFSRMAHINVGRGTFIPEHSYLKQMLDKVELLTPLTDYIESFGEITLSSGAVVHPRYPVYSKEVHIEPKHKGSPTLADALSDLEDVSDDEDDVPQRVFYDHIGLPLPEGGNFPDVGPAIMRYNAGIKRAEVKSLRLRAVDNKVLTGKASLLSIESGEPGRVVGRVCQSIPEEDAQIGAAYGYRHWRDYEYWPGEHNHVLYPVFTSAIFSSEVKLSTTVYASVSARKEY